MNSNLFIKDIKLLVKDFKFQIFFLILFALFILSAFNGAANYESVSNDYNRLIDTHNQNIKDISNLALTNMARDRNSITVASKPSLSVLFNVNDSYPIGLKNNVMFYEPTISFGTINLEVFRINWYFIFTIMMSFILLILSFETISAEKRSGTLRLLSVYGFKRLNVLWSKYFSYMLLYLLIIIPPALISMLIFFSLTASWDMSYMMRYLSIILLSIPFASFFLLVGIFISMLKNHRNAIVVMVFVWLLVVIIIPQSAYIFGKNISTIKTNIEYKRLQDEAWEREWNAKLEVYGHQVAMVMNIESGLRADAVYAADQIRNDVKQQRMNDETRQWQTIQNIARISPFKQFEDITEIILENGSYMFQSMQETMRYTLAQIRNLVKEQDSKDETSLHQFYSWAGNDMPPYGYVSFSHQIFEHPELLLVTDIHTDDIMTKLSKILIRLIPIIALNLIFIIMCIIKLDRLDIR